MKELRLTVRIFFCGEYENTATYYIEIPQDTPEEKEMNLIMGELYEVMFDNYGDYDEWEDGEISWTLDSWEVTDENV